jgi:hypothetical protein
VRTSRKLCRYSTQPGSRSSGSASTQAGGASAGGGVPSSGKTVWVVVVRQPEKNAGTPADSKR